MQHMAKICIAKNEPQKSDFILWLLTFVAISQNLGIRRYGEILRAETREIANRIKGRLRRVQQNDYSVELSFPDKTLTNSSICPTHPFTKYGLTSDTLYSTQSN